LGSSNEKVFDFNFISLDKFFDIYIYSAVSELSLIGINGVVVSQAIT
jgi:hypothetical protein